MTLGSLLDILRRAADNQGLRGVCSYSSGLSGIGSSTRLKYTELDSLAASNAIQLRRLQCDIKSPVILLHFEDHLDNIIWFWSTLYAGYIPAMSTALPRCEDHRIRHLCHLSEMFESPICLTRKSLQDLFPRKSPLRTVTIESLNDSPADFAAITETSSRVPIGCDGCSPALMMLTSGSTGLPKAVSLTHNQILASLQGKSQSLRVDDTGHSFLNWIRLDHVGSLIEIHLHALFVGYDQVHVPPNEIISRPALFLDLISRHRVARTFAPNFFLADVGRYLEASRGKNGSRFDLKCLRYIVSGGEAVVVSTGAKVSRLLAQHGAPENVIVPGFGMTETCAGCIYSMDFPAYDTCNDNEFAALGRCIIGVEARIVSIATDSILACPGEVGHLELKGPLVFSGYYNNQTATSEAFSPDGWFRTGDTGYIDTDGRINLSGRTKELITVNGVKYAPQQLEAAIEDANIPGIVSDCVICFPFRPRDADTERPCVIYQHSYCVRDVKARYETMTAITHRITMITNVRPYILPLQSIRRTSLGKLPRSNLQREVASGHYKMEEASNRDMIKRHRRSISRPPGSPTEQAIVEELAELLSLPQEDIGIDTDLFELGLTSLTLIRLQHGLRSKLSLNEPIPLATMMAHNTVRGLSETCQHHHQYIPAVKLQPNGNKTPLWLIHPAAGEALIFINMAKLITDRPVYAFRARGFHHKEPYFTSIDECIRTYHSAMKKLQPHGPYAILRYSYGTMLAFELAKYLEKQGDQVQYLACLNRPPYVSPILKRVTWTDCLLSISYFLGLLSLDSYRSLIMELSGLPKQEALARVIEEVDPAQLLALGLNKGGLEQWINVTFSLQEIGREYEPNGIVNAHMNVFHCTPLEFLNVTAEEWKKRLAAWDNFSSQKVELNHVPGDHANVLGPDYVQVFVKRLNEAMALQGL
ncbi:thioesterase domain protein [Aspergillus eucalypticola CBS 122712]|uniref:Thioesterase domain protein n=1 Tax=Aspergillus eucalypticola (strain CBS 122712 / IBT 29274) TaxID=1448314 RepID=A0A317UX89_ASPEC|nr:thioesterase domain protein [Aspergillus eucalypticola CBS 122712]PWY66654.1 thioesterase domain protein [Aspergillus eucalypticola CBS 122712]